MRILKLLFFMSLFGGILLLIAYFLGREVLIYMATDQIKSSLNNLKQIKGEGLYAKQCYSQGATDTSQIVYQLRFTSPRHYVTEVLCSPHSSQAIKINEADLVTLVEKKPEYSGIILGENSSGLILAALGRQTGIVLELMEVSVVNELTETSLAKTGPTTNCAGYGYTCCDPISTLGKGRQLLNVLDCPKSCYYQCINRPIILSFNSQPIFEPGGRQIKISKGESVTFSYLISSNQAGDLDLQPTAESSNLLIEIQAFLKTIKLQQSKTAGSQLKITIDFGDGQRQNFTELQGVVDHQYQCPTTGCHYGAKLMVEQSSVTAADNPLSKIEVIVN